MKHIFSFEPERMAESLNWPDDYANIIRKQKYHRFHLPKKGGQLRLITAPGKKLKFLQKTLANALQYIYLDNIPSAVHGYVSGLNPVVGTRHILSNAQAHTNKDYLLNHDIDNFFPSIDSLKLMDCFRTWFPEMPLATQGLLTSLCTYKNALPMGAPSSPVLSNMALLPLDESLLSLCNDHHITYTRYVDDLTFSSQVPIGSDLENQILAMLRKHEFEVNDDKRKYYQAGMPKMVTGLILKGEEITVDQELLHNIERCIKEHEQLRWLSRQLEMDKKWLRYKVKHTEQSIRGQLAFLEQIHGESDATYLKLKKAFEHAQNYRPPSFDFYF